MKRLLVACALCACGGTDFTSVLGDASASDGGSEGSSAADAARDGMLPPTHTTCGPMQCAAMQTCCVTQNNPPQFTCAQGACTNGQTALQCAKASDCPMGSVCCVRRMNGNATSSCALSCGQNEAQLCDPKEMPTGCPPNQPCSNSNIADWNLPPSFATCGGKGN